MKAFNYYVPTRIYFGEGKAKELPNILSEYGKKVLLVYGGGSIKKNGIYDEVCKYLKDFEIYELSGVDPNPRMESVRKGVELCRKHHIDVILPVGGGSCIDCSKAIAAGVYYNGDVWEIVKGKGSVEKALPIVTVLTLSATGSEMNSGAVITNWDTNEKLSLGSVHLFPKASILDPTYTYSVPKKQTAAGSADILSHLFEIYFNHTKGAMVQEELAHGLMRTVIHYGEKAYHEPENYEARANLMWSASLALNSLVGNGFGGSWSCHPMEHVLSAYYDVTHGEGLAILTPAWMRYILNDDTLSRFVLYGTHVWGIDASLDAYEIANKAIDLTQDYLVNHLHLPKTLKEIGIDDTKLEIMAQDAVDSKGGVINGFMRLEKDDVLAIYKSCLE